MEIHIKEKDVSYMERMLAGHCKAPEGLTVPGLIT
jgi:hypothetical protein